MALQIYLALLIGVVTLLYFYITRNSNYWKKRGILGPKPKFFFGNLKDVVLLRKSVNMQFYEFYEQYPNEKVVGVFRMTNPLLLVRDLDLIQNIMIKDFDNFVDRGTQEFGKKGLSQNLFMTSGDKWRVLRTRLSPIFSSGKLKNMFHLIEGNGTQFIQHIEPLLKKTPVQDVYPLVQKYTIASISACAFGLDIDLNDYDTETYAKIDKLIFTPSSWVEIEHLIPGLLNSINFDFFPSSATKFFYKLVETVVQQRNGKPSNRKDFMDLMLELRNAGEIKGPKKREDEEERLLKITDELLAAQTFVFYAGGYETSATTMSFLMYELARNQDIQDRLVAEINNVLDKYDNVVTYESLKEMTYLAQVFDEVLRMYPIVDPLHRKAKEAFKVPGTDMIIERGTVCQVSVRGIHYDEKYYPEPNKFDPDRFTPENIKSRHPSAYMPFGIGSRNCIGMRFAKVQSSVCIVKILQKYRVEPAPSTPETIDYDGSRIILGSKVGYPLKFIPRDS